MGRRELRCDANFAASAGDFAHRGSVSANSMTQPMPHNRLNHPPRPPASLRTICQRFPCRPRGLLLGAAVAFALAALPMPGAGGTPPPSRPNIVLILVDDLGKEWVSCYGAEEVETPRIDALADSGTRFENFYSMPQCTPTRVALLTGQYPFRNGWINHWDVPRWGDGAHFDPALNPSFAGLLRAAGYRTCAAGKWQVNDFRVQPDVMTRHGFDEWCMWTGFETGNPPSAERYHDPYIHTKSGSGTRRGAFGDDVFADFIIDFMRRHRDDPFLVYFPMCLTHPPLTATPLEPDAASPRDRHLAMVRHADHLAGRIVDTLGELGLRERTLVVWTTDNGTSAGIDGRRGGRLVKGGKGRTLEPGINAPFIASWPGTVPAGRTSRALIDVTDLLPTFAELAGARIPDGLVVDGRSFAAVLAGRAESSERRWILAMGGGPGSFDPESGRVVNRTAFRDRVLRDERFKLFVGRDRAPERLVDLDADPDEATNLMDSADPEVARARDHLVEAAAALPAVDANPRYDPLPPQPWDQHRGRSPGSAVTPAPAR